jgi:hypothetical protein
MLMATEGGAGCAAGVAASAVPLRTNRLVAARMVVAAAARMNMIDSLFLGLFSAWVKLGALCGLGAEDSKSSCFAV